MPEPAGPNTKVAQPQRRATGQATENVNNTNKINNDAKQLNILNKIIN
jgi:hypothetical protein